MKKFSFIILLIISSLHTLKAQVSTLGKDFWLGYMEIVGNPLNAPVQFQKLYISSPTTTTVSVSIPLQNWSNSYSIIANQITQITLPTSAHTVGSESIQSTAVHITSNDYISVFATNESGARTEASVVLPKEALGGTTEYIVASYQGVYRNPASFGPNDPASVTPQYPGINVPPRSEFLIVAFEDNTELTIVPTAETCGGKPAGSPFNITLNQGQVYQVQGIAPPSNSLTDNRPYDLTGSRIFGSSNCKPFAVFSGANATITNSDCMAWEHIYEQQYPVNTWGKEYLISPFYKASQGYLFRVIASENNTTILVDGGSSFVLNQGEYREFNISDNHAACVKGDKPIAIAQYMKGQNCNGVPTAIQSNGTFTNIGDPAMIMLNPIDQTVKNVTFNTVTSSNLEPPNPAQYYINIITKTTNTNLVKLNGLPYSSNFSPFPNCNGYSYATVSIARGSYTLTSDSTFIAYHYGYGRAEGYAYSVGASFENLQRNFTATPQSICVGGTVDFAGFGTGIISYAWDFGDGFTATGQKVSHTFNTGATYPVKMKVTVNGGCGEDIITKNIEVLPYPIVNLGATRTICPRETIVLDAGTYVGSPQYLWNTGETTQTIQVSKIGTYSVKVTNKANCSGSGQVEVKMFAETPVNITDLKDNYCIDNQTVTLKGTPINGVFTIDGNIATQFNPALLGTGIHRVIYSFQDSNGCNNRDTLDVKVNPLPIVNITGLQSAYCIDHAPIPLTATPSGGKFTVNGTEITQFDPAFWQVGVFKIIYTYTDANTCVNSTNVEIKIIPLPVLQFDNLANAYCVDAPSFVLSATPSGGTFKIDNQSFTSFNPASFGVKLIEVTYTYQDANSCVNTIKKNVQINPLPTPKITSVLRPIYCQNSAPIPLNASPSGGQFSINGNVINQLEPSTLAVGTYKILYTYQDANLCVNYDSLQVAIEIPPVVDILGLQTNFCKDAPSFDLTGFASSEGTGFFTIDNSHIQVTQINPSLLSTGNHTVTYTFTDSRSECVSAITKPFSVSNLPKVDLVTNGLADQYCYNVAPFSLSRFGNPSGGNFYINGILKTTFNPYDADLGLDSTIYNTVNVIYTYQDANNCLNLATKKVLILPLPKVKILNLKANYCVQNAAFQLKAEPLGGFFQIDGNASNGIFNPTLLGLGEHLVTYTEKNGCVTDKIKVMIHPPLPELNLKGLTVCSFSGRATILDAGEGSAYLWNTNKKTRQLPVIQSGTYTVEVTDSLGCKTFNTIVVVERCVPKFQIPTAFTPNNDGLNDDLEVVAQDINEFTLTVYNRWGEIIYISNNIFDKWDGTQNGKPVPSGVYVCTIDYKELPDKIQKTFKSSVSVLR